MSATVNMINLQVLAEGQIAIDKAAIDPATGQSVYDRNIAANPKHYLWQGTEQTLPLGMDGEPVQFAQKLREALPMVNTLRIGFNEHSFNPDGSLHADFEAFLAEAVAQGFEIAFVYAGGDVQNIGNSGSAWGHTDLSNSEAYAALEENFADVSGAWGRLLDWLDAHGAVKAGVYGFELMNEPAGYRHSIRENGSGEGYAIGDFVRLYADHSIALAAQIAARAEGRILVDGWGYAGDFATLAETIVTPEGQTALEYLRAGIGDALTWSAHLYPGWGETGSATSPETMEALLEAHFAPILGDDIVVTETNAHGYVDAFSGGENATDFLTAAYQWFADHGIGLGWFPGVETGGSNFVVIDGNGALRFLHQHSYAHGMNAFSLGESDPALAGDDALTVTLVAGKLRNEGYEADHSGDGFDPVTHLGHAFGFAGNDTLTGTDSSNDFLYGGTGHDTLIGGGGDDFLFGQQGNDFLFGGAHIDHLFGGSGNDMLFGGSGYDQMRGGKGFDIFVTDGQGDDVILGFAPGEDLVDLDGAFSSWEEITAAMALADADGDGAADDTVITVAPGHVLTMIGVAPDALSASDFVGMTPANGRVDGTRGADFIGAGTFVDLHGESVSAAGAKVRARGGHDTLIGEAGRDTLIAGGGRDRAEGGGGRDILKGGGGHDRLFGGAGSDRLEGQNGRDRLFGGDGNDTLYGGKADDTLNGGNGSDRLAGGIGNDRLTGGAGADTFIFASGDGSDTITDFDVTADRLDLTALATTWEALTFTETAQGLTLATADVTILLEGLADGAIDQSHVLL